MKPSILRVPGIETTSAEFRRGLWELAERNGWNVDNLATVISAESGFNPAAKNPLPKQTASGLIQMIDKTARELGVPGGAEGLRGMTAEEQLPWIEAYYRRAFAGAKSLRPVDYYVVLWGAKPGIRMDSTLASVGERRYELNNKLDVNSDGVITPRDLERRMQRYVAMAKGQRIDVDSDPVVVTAAGGLAVALLAVLAWRWLR